MDRISPYKGYYVAACALPMGELGDKFIGYAKVCASKPSSCWEGIAISEHSPEGLCNVEDEALTAAEAEARRTIDELPAVAPRRKPREGPDH